MRPIPKLANRIHITVNNIDQSKKFYKAILESLGLRLSGESYKAFWMEDLYVSEDSDVSKNITIGFNAPNPGAVDVFRDEALHAGGKVLDGPAIKKSDSYSYFAVVLDPDGNKILATYHML